MHLDARTALAEALAHDDRIVTAVVELLAREPGAAREECLAEARRHLEFLAGAVQAGVPQLFADYARWCAALPDVVGSPFAAHLDVLAAHLSASPLLAADAEGRKLVEAMFVVARRALAPASSPSVSSVSSVSSKPGALESPPRLAYLAAALGGRPNAAWEATQEAKRDGWSLARIYRDLVIDTQRRLGELWARGEITVAQEHMASSVSQAVIARLYSEIPRGRIVGRVLMVGAVGERHALPAHLAADLLELQGWDVAFVGTDVPTTSVITSIEAERPDVVGISATMPTSLPGTVALVRTLQAKFAELRLVVGGLAFRGAESLARELRLEVVNGDAFADAGGAFSSAHES